jgi:hypothetical protein
VEIEKYGKLSKKKGKIIFEVYSPQGYPQEELKYHFNF